ncbi:cyclic nucleotide-gated cation channel beta-1-like [Macrosteles quadrilineatus]|uniref:cyclic nucleotide-gated cation channel beta-1-like n=1 Tax=Macrosteles quadrilineatus TaxID=74068 RepID=UPI0023E2CBCA|nr:cyclic nucleotide-gated cation channel beta-1-like [Macrosteles quadrilineatus]
MSRCPFSRASLILSVLPEEKQDSQEVRPSYLDVFSSHSRDTMPYFQAESADKEDEPPAYATLEAISPRQASDENVSILQIEGPYFIEESNRFEENSSFNLDYEREEIREEGGREEGREGEEEREEGRREAGGGEEGRGKRGEEEGREERREEEGREERREEGGREGAEVREEGRELEVDEGVTKKGTTKIRRKKSTSAEEKTQKN